MDGKAQRGGDGWINGQTVKEGRGHTSNQRRMERSGEKRSPPPSFDAPFSCPLFRLLGEYIFNEM